MKDVEKTDGERGTTRGEACEDTDPQVVNSEIQHLRDGACCAYGSSSYSVPYEFEYKSSVPREVFYSREVTKAKRKNPRKDIKGRIFNAWRYFYTLKNLPLSYILKGTDKVVYLDDFLVMERENRDIHVFKRIEKLKKKGMLVEEIFSEESPQEQEECSTDVSESEPVAPGPMYSVDRVRRSIFKKRVLLIRVGTREGRMGCVWTFEKNAEYCRVVQKHLSRRRRETPISRRERHIHPSHITSINKVSPRLRVLSRPADIIGALGPWRPPVLSTHEKPTRGTGAGEEEKAWDGSSASFKSEEVFIGRLKIAKPDDKVGKTFFSTAGLVETPSQKIRKDNENFDA